MVLRGSLIQSVERAGMKSKFDREKELLDLLGIDSSIYVVYDEEVKPEVIYEPEQNRVQIYTPHFAGFVECIGRVLVGENYGSVYATPAFCESSAGEAELKARLTKLWTPLVAGWSWYLLSSLLPEDLIDDLRSELRLQLDLMNLRLLDGGKPPRPEEFIRYQVGYLLLGGAMALRIRANNREMEEKYREYIERILECAVEEPSHEHFEHVVQVFYPNLHVKVKHTCLWLDML